MRKIRNQRAISPIIATLLLILIAIAAGVVLYAYVSGFIGNSTTNPGGSINSLSVDQLNLLHSSTLPVTAYVHNLGPTTESYNTGFFLKSATTNYVLGPAVAITITAASTPTIASVTITYSAANALNVNVYLTAVCASGTIALSVTGMGSSGSLAATSCTGGVGPYTAVLGSLVPAVSSTFSATTGTSLAGTVTSGSTYTIGTLVTAGTISSSINTVAQFTLAPQTIASSWNTNFLSSSQGTTFTFQVTGTDGGTSSTSAKVL